MRRRTVLRGIMALAVGTALLGAWYGGPKLLELTGFHLGKVGYFAEAEERIASLPIQYVGSHVCDQCHVAEHEEWRDAKHQDVDCEVCHGPAEAHIAGVGTPSLDASREACAACHEEVPARPGDFPQVSLAHHNTGATCVTCHNPMGPDLRFPHAALKDADCVVCHGAGGLAPLPGDHESQSSETCRRCHQPSSAEPPLIPHKTEGRQCSQCHGSGALVGALPTSHQDRVDQMCLVCHQGASVLPAAVGHRLEGKELCQQCHGQGLVASLPSGHQEYGGGECQLCHQEFLAPPLFPHGENAAGVCTTCHGVGVMVGPLPASHQGRTEETCSLCHEASGAGEVATPAPGAATPTPSTVTPAPEETGGGEGTVPLVPHSLEGRSECAICHGTGGFQPYPESHAGRAGSTCLVCHGGNG